MRISGNRPGVPARLQHAAAFHDTTEDLVARLVPMVEAATHRGEPVALALHPRTEEALRAALSSPSTPPSSTPPSPTPPSPTLHSLSGPGHDACSGQTVALSRARELREMTRAEGTVTVLTEHRCDLDGPDGAFWTELDAAVNVALADLPVHLTCFFPEMPLHLSVLHGARRNHPLLLVDGELRHNPEHRDPHAVLADTPIAPPALLGAPDLHLRFRAWQLQEVRREVRRLAESTGFVAERVDDVVQAVNEVATNAVEHGARDGELYLWATADGLVCEVHDSGVLRDPLPGLVAPHPSDPHGRGLWIARQLCDLLHVWTDQGGTHVRVRAAP